MRIGINLGVPPSRKAFFQRIGRVGRKGPGTFHVIAHPRNFRRFGETFRDYYNGAVEPSYLYLKNRFIQFAHARCLCEESAVLKGDTGKPPSGVKWPEGFAEVLKYVPASGGRPREFDSVAHVGGDSPHLNYPPRQVGEANFRTVVGSEYVTRIGDIATNQAIREAYPGATYLHMGTAYYVHEWRTTSFERDIRVSHHKNPTITTRPILRKVVTFDLRSEGIVEERIKRSLNSCVAEAHLLVNESVEGYRIGKESFLYKDLRAKKPNMSRKQRDFRTTGVIIRIQENWFSGSKENKSNIREAVADGLLKLICRDKSISPQVIDATHTNIARLTEKGPKKLTDTIVIYDSVYGGLRLTEGLFLALERYVVQLDKAADLAGNDAMVDKVTTRRLVDWVKTLTDATTEGYLAEIEAPDGWFQIYRPGSSVRIFINGKIVEREIVEPQLSDPFQTGTRKLWYRYKTKDGSAYCPHDQAQANGQDWSWVYWNPDTNEFRELDDPDLFQSGDPPAE